MDSQKTEEMILGIANIATEKARIDPTMYTRYNVKRGLRNNDGTGVLVGLTEVGEVMSYIVDDAE
nr:citrate synthase [Saccharofermentans sp.]